MYCTYKLTFESGRVYVGSTNNFTNRLEQHKRRFLKEYNDLIVKYEVLNRYDTIEECNRAESELIQVNYNNSYNLRTTSDYVISAKRSTKVREHFSQVFGIPEETPVHVPSLTEQKKIVSLTNEVALYLYNYYISKAMVTHFNLLDDTLVGRSIGWTARKVKDNRLKLKNAGLIHFQQRKLDGVLHSVWVFGIDQVNNYKENASDVIVDEAISTKEHIVTAGI